MSGPGSGTYDIVTIGGGLGGAGFARLMAEAGARVLVLERSTEFRDRVRGEVLVPWGVAEAEKLGFHAVLRPLSNDLLRWDVAVAGTTVLSRDLTASGGLGVPVLTYYHPEMQASLLQAAQDGGADVRRGARVTQVQPGRPGTVMFDHEGHPREATARLVVGADGRGSAARAWGGFEVVRDPARRLFAGVLFEDMLAPEHVLFSSFLPATGCMTYVFPQGRGRVRAYIGFPADGSLERFQGSDDVPRFVATAIEIGAAREWYASARPAGPLATFDATDEWVPHPYRNGVALVGDAAATSDPTWGQGMSVTLRDLRLLRDALLQGDDWDQAGHAYAEGHDDCHHHIHTADGWYTDLFLEVGAAADARRAHALPLLLAEPDRLPDTPLAGPEVAADDAARRRFFGEDVAP